MIQAFDVLLQIPVTADIAAKNRIDEPFRYECLCCGEEVYIAATNSTKKAPHFRHRRGNSDRECELYLGSTGIAGALNAAQKRTHSRTEIYFDIKQKIFYAAVSFPKEKLQEFEDKSCILEFHSTYNSPPYEKVRINHQNFAPDSMVQFPLKLTTNDCYITISGANYRSHYEILSNNDFPTFFKITLGENSGNFARRIVGGKIYTNTSYYIIAKNQKIIQKIVDLGENIAISAVDEKISAAFETPYGKFDTTIKGLVYEEEDNIHIIYDTDRYTLPNMQDLKLVLSATRDDEQIPVMPLVETIQKYACSLSGTERARCQIILDAINQHGMKVSRKELRHILNLKSNLGKQINRFIFEESGVLIGNALKSARNKEALFGGVLGIRHFCKDDAQYYYSGYLGKSINRSFPHACRIRKVCSTGQTLQFQRYLPLLEVDFIRANGWTVIPFPFKYLREWRLQQG